MDSRISVLRRIKSVIRHQKFAFGGQAKTRCNYLDGLASDHACAKRSFVIIFTLCSLCLCVRILGRGRKKPIGLHSCRPFVVNEQQWMDKGVVVEYVLKKRSFSSHANDFWMKIKFAKKVSIKSSENKEFV